MRGSDYVIARSGRSGCDALKLKVVIVVVSDDTVSLHRKHPSTHIRY